MPRAQKQSNGTTTKINKSAWIRSQPASLSANEVVSKAKAEGIALSPAQVYTARSMANRKTGGRTRQPATAARPAGNDEVTFRRFVLKLGLDRVEAMLAQIKRGAGL
jgi:hypothetical protein